MNSQTRIEARKQTNIVKKVVYRFLNLPPFNVFKKCFIEELGI